ncbi:MAG: adenosylcobinamide amidohydrolase [Kineosporiaceae bacterium]
MNGPSAPDLLRHWDDAGERRPVLVRALPPGWRAISSAVLGGGLGPCGWWLNAQVSKHYHHPDPVAHAAELAASFGLSGPGVAMLTAADASRFTVADCDGVETVVTVGLGLPIPAAATPQATALEDYSPPVEGAVPEVHPAPGTINMLVAVPVALSDAALVNAVMTATEAKTQALVEAGVPGTGTSSDAVCIACPVGTVDDEGLYGGPRSAWGARIARAVHRAVADGTTDWTTQNPPGDPHRRWGSPWPEARAAR